MHTNDKRGCPFSNIADELQLELAEATSRDRVGVSLWGIARVRQRSIPVGAREPAKVIIEAMIFLHNDDNVLDWALLRH